MFPDLRTWVFGTQYTCPHSVCRQPNTKDCRNPIPFRVIQTHFKRRTINALLSNSPLQQDMWPIYISHWFSRCYHEEMWKLKKYFSFWPWTKYNLCVDILVCEIKIVQIKCSLYFHCPKALHLVQFEKHTFSSFRTIQGNTAILCYTLYATFLSLFLLQIWFNLIARTCLEFSVCRESLHVS